MVLKIGISSSTLICQTSFAYHCRQHWSAEPQIEAGFRRVAKRGMVSGIQYDCSRAGAVFHFGTWKRVSRRRWPVVGDAESKAPMFRIVTKNIYTSTMRQGTEPRTTRVFLTILLNRGMAVLPGMRGMRWRATQTKESAVTPIVYLYLLSLLTLAQCIKWQGLSTSG